MSTRRGFTLGLIAGFVHYAGTVYWTGATVSTFGGLPVIVAVLVAGLLALYMAAYIAVFGAIAAILIAAVRRRRAAGSRRRRGSRWSTCAASSFGGFPWIPLGNTMVTLLPIAQLASVVGVYGLSLFVALLNTGFAVAAISTGRRRTRRRSPSTLAADRRRVDLGRHAARVEHADAGHADQGRPDPGQHRADRQVESRRAPG